MPKIPIPTAQRGPGVMQAQNISPNAFGAQAFGQVTEFGQALERTGFILQQQRDETDLIGKVNDYKVHIAGLPSEIIADPEIKPQDRLAHFKAKADAFRDDLGKDSTNAVRIALSKHAAPLMAEGLIHMQAADITEQTNAARANLFAEQDQFAEQKAFAFANNNADEVAKIDALRLDALQRAETRRIINPIERLTAEREGTHRTFELAAVQNPNLMITVTDTVKAGGAAPLGMDATKAVYYGNLAYNELHRRELVEQQQEQRRAKESLHQSKAAEQDYYQRYTEVDHSGARLYSTEQLLREAGLDMVLQEQKPEVVKFLNSMLMHERTAASSSVDYSFYNRTILPNIYSGRYKTEMEVLLAGADRLGSHMTTAISAFQTYRTMVTAKSTQDFQFGERLIRGTFSLPPGASIDPAGVLEAGNRALDRFNTWYTSQVERAAKEGPQILTALDLQAEARKIRDQEYATLQDNLIPILDTTRNALRFNSVEDVKKARERNEISAREANLYLQQLETFEHLQTMSSKKLVAPSVRGRVGKD